MKRMTFLTMLTALLALWTIAAWSVETPKLINFQGILRDGSGNPVANGNYDVTFKIWDAAAAGNLEWSETQTVATTNGLFTALIGAATVGGVPDAVFNNTIEERWLGITVAPDVAEMTPRQRMVSVPYTYEFDNTGPEVISSAAVGPSLKGENSLSDAGNVIGVEGSADNPGAGDAYGGFFKTTASGTGKHYGLRSEANASSGTASSYGVFGDNNSTTAGIHYGVVGHALGAGAVQNRAVEGVAFGATGLNIGVYGSASGTGAYAGRFENARVRVGGAGTETIVDGDGDLYLEDELEVDGVAALANGTAASPALTFSGDLNTGIYQPGANIIGLATAGIERVQVNSAGNVGIGTATPGSRLEVEEDINSSAVLTISNPNTGTASGQRLQFDSEDGSGTGGGAFIAVFDNTSSSPNLMRIANNLASGDIDFLTAGAARMTIDQAGNVGIGDATPSFQLDVEQSANTAAGFNRLTDDGTIIALQQGSITEGTISVAGGVVSYNAFTGSHYGLTDEVLERGELVTLTGLNRNSHDNPKSEVIYGIKRSAGANDPACLGSYLALQEPAQPAGSENPYLVMAVGNGDMWVVDEGGDILPGDYLISSSTPGHAMKDAPEKYPLGYIVARAAEPVNWGNGSEMLGGRKHKKISVLFESFVRSSNAALAKIVDAQQKEIEELKALVKTLVAKEQPDGKLLGELK